LSIKIKVPGKLILLGEYAVLEGANALVSAVDRHVMAEISASKNEFCLLSGNLTSDTIRFLIGSDGDIIPDQGQSNQSLSTMNFAMTIISQIHKKIIGSGFSIQPYDLRIDTSQFYMETNKMKIGLGSSAALTVALITSILKILRIEKDISPSKYDQFVFACKTHFLAQGNRGSGIDIAASLYGGINIYNMHSIDYKEGSRRISPVSFMDDVYLLPVWTGVSASTRELLLQVEKFRSKFETEYKETISRLSTLSNAGCIAYDVKKRTDFIDIVHDYYQVLKKISDKSKIPIISDIHERIAGIVYSSGGVYKPSGAGGGDIGIAFCESEKTLNKVQKELNQNKIETLSIGISEQGVIVEK